MNTFKQQCIELRKQDYTLPEIAKKTGRPRTSVYHHIQSIPLSKSKQKEIQAAQAAKVRRYALERKGKSVRLFRKIERWDSNLVFLVSHFLFDGDIQHGSCSYNNRSSVLVARVENAMKTIYDFEPKRYSNQLTGVQRISYYNVALRAHIEKMSLELIEKITSLPKEPKRTFIQSFFDDEGCADFRPQNNKRRVRGYQKNGGILKIIQKLLYDFGIGSFIQLPNEIVIAHKENLIKFRDEINFSPGVRINAKRSNSIWKQSLEKREILRRAIASYKPVGSNGVHRG